jgi:hypothetical protein
VLNRLTEAQLNAEFVETELIIFGKEDQLIDESSYVQGGLAINVQFKNYYQNF